MIPRFVSISVVGAALSERTNIPPYALEVSSKNATLIGFSFKDFTSAATFAAYFLLEKSHY